MKFKRTMFPILGKRHLHAKSGTFLLALALSNAPLFAETTHDKVGESSVPAASATQADVAKGFHAEVFVSGLDYPSSLEMGNDGEMFIGESGWAAGGPDIKPRILKIAKDGTVSTLLEAGLTAPLNDLLWHDGKLYVSHRGKISVVENGNLKDLVTGLPSFGDHQNNQLTVGPDGMIYFGQGTVTNSGVIGPDNAKWLEKYPGIHDESAKAVTFVDKAFESKNPLKDGGEMAKTRPFQSFNHPDASVSVEGTNKANGTILRFNPDGGEVEVYAWGLRNPYGLIWTGGKLYASENGLDARGSRPVANDKEDLYLIKQGAWYGWPDFGSGIPVTDPRFKPDDSPAPEFIMTDHPDVEKPLMTFPEHSAATKLAAAPGGAFGGDGILYLSFFGHMTPRTGETDKHGGHRVVRIDLAKGDSETFFTKAGHGESHSGDDHGHASEHGQGGDTTTAGPRRLMDVTFSADGNALYVVDFGTVEMSEDGKPMPVNGTGLIWRIQPDGAAAAMPAAGIKVK